MPKIIDPDDINVGTEITIDTTARTFTLVEAGNLTAKDGVTGNAIWAKFVDLWTDSTYNRFPFPMNIIDARSGQFIFGQDPGGTYNGWRPANDTTRQMIRDAGWSEFSNAGALNREYVGIVQLGNVNAGAQMYYQKALGGPAIDFTFDDEANEAIQVFGDASNGNFDDRTYFKIFAREQGKIYDDATLADVGETGTGAFKVQLPVSNGDDLKITDLDSEMTNAPYDNITIEYFATNQNRSIGGTNYPFRVIIDGNNATAEQIYTKIQFFLRQNTDIDSGAGNVIGKTADALLSFVGDTLKTTQGVYIDNFNTDDVNRLVFTDQNGVERTEPFTATGSLSFNSFLTQGGSGYYRMYFSALPGANDDWGENGAITVDDTADADIEGTISSASIPFTFDYDGNNQGGRTPGTDANVTVVAGNPGSAKPVISNYTITRSTGQIVTLTAEQDRGYID